MSTPLTTIQSILHPDKLAYRVVSDWSDHWHVKGSNPLALHIVAFQTYGDGTTQHSGVWCPQLHEVTDVCLSIASAIVANPSNEAWQTLTDLINYCNSTSITFALSVKYDEGKCRYYSLTDRKITAATAKKHDRRYSPIQTWHNGSPASACHVLMGAANWDWLIRLFVLDELRAHVGYSPLWEELVPASVHFVGDWTTALQTLRHALEAVIALNRSRRALSCAIANSPKQIETATVTT